MGNEEIGGGRSFASTLVLSMSSLNLVSLSSLLTTRNSMSWCAGIGGPRASVARSVTAPRWLAMGTIDTQRHRQRYRCKQCQRLRCGSGYKPTARDMRSTLG
jgi:hypothetical protein